MRHIRHILLMSLWLVLLLGCGTPEASAPASSMRHDTALRSGSATVTVFAASSLSESFKEIGQRFQQTYGTSVVFNFAGSQQLVQQLAQGATADVFASANSREMDNAVVAGVVISGTQRIFARNRLVVIVPKDNPAQINTLQDLGRPGVKLIFAAPQVPAGAYTRQALGKMSSDPTFGADFQAHIDANVVSLEDNVKAVVTKVSLGEVDAGVVYASDVTSTVSPSLTTLAIPDAFNQIAAYPIAPTANPPAGAAAEQFVQFVLSAEGQEILARYHFMVGTGG